MPLTRTIEPEDFTIGAVASCAENGANIVCAWHDIQTGADIYLAIGNPRVINGGGRSETPSGHYIEGGTIQTEAQFTAALCRRIMEIGQRPRLEGYDE